VRLNGSSPIIVAYPVVADVSPLELDEMPFTVPSVQEE
jgi:hypothetical protein